MVVDELIPVLPCLIMSTDECTIFVSNKVISNKAEYITSRPKNINQLPDIFCTDISGD